MKKDKVENYLFLGLPGSGKTTCFSLMAYHLQQEANQSSRIRFSYAVSEDEGVPDSSDFINDCIQHIKKQKWPAKTMACAESGYAFELVTSQRHFPSKSYQKSFIEYRDYSGEAFEAAFGIRPPEDGWTEQTKKDGEDIKNRVNSARGIFLVLDAEELFNGTDKNVCRKNLERLFKFVRDTNPKIKLAVIFNKLELFPGKNKKKIAFETMFRNEYGNAYSYLSFLNHRFFCVYPLGKVETDDEGNVVPPKELSPRNDLEPMRWMLNIKQLSEHNDGVFGVAKGCSLVLIFLIVTPILLLVAGFCSDFDREEAIFASLAIVAVIWYFLSNHHQKTNLNLFL